MTNIFLKLKNDKLFCITIIIFIFAFFIFRPYFMQERGLLYGGDDEGYFATATAIAFFQFPDYSKEHDPYGDVYPISCVGPGIMASPFVFLFSLIDRVEDSRIIEKREINNIINSWSLFGFIISTIFYFYLGVVLLFKTLNFYFNERISFFAIIFMILFQFFPLYVFRRPIFSNIYEFFLQAIMIYFLVKEIKTKFIDKNKIIFPILVGLIIGLITLVRYNNIFFTIIWPISLFCFTNNKFYLRSNYKKLLLSYIVGIIVLWIFKFIPIMLTKLTIYDSAVPNLFLKIENPMFYIKVFLNMIFGIDFGLVFTAPYLIIGLVCLFIYNFDFKKRLLIALVPLIINIILILNSGTQLGWYGYRLIFFSVVPFLLFPFALFFKKMEEKNIFKKWLIVFFIYSLFPVISMLVFEGNNSNLTLTQGVQYFGIIDWGNKFYQLEVWKTLFLAPLEFLKSIFKGGPLYLIYLFSYVFNLKNSLTSVILEKYPFFSLRILIKTLIIYISPFLAYLTINKIKYKILNK